MSTGGGGSLTFTDHDQAASAPEPNPEGPESDTADDLAVRATSAPLVGGPAPVKGQAHAVIARSGLNLRAGPATGFPVIDVLPFGTAVQVLSREGGWGLVDRNGDGAADGHVLLSYLRLGMAPAGPHDTQSSFVRMDRPLLQEIMNRCAGHRVQSPLDLDVVAWALDEAMRLAEANTILREIAFLSQSVIETDFFKTFEEYGRGRNKRYGKFYGRGMHQLTWEETYRKCSMAVFHDMRLVQNPNLIIEDINVNIAATAWYWRDYKPFNALADARNIDEIIYRLYGGRITSSKPEVRESVKRRRSYYVTIGDILKSA